MLEVVQVAAGNNDCRLESSGSELVFSQDAKTNGSSDKTTPVDPEAKSGPDTDSKTNGDIKTNEEEDLEAIIEAALAENGAVSNSDEEVSQTMDAIPPSPTTPLSPIRMSV